MKLYKTDVNTYRFITNIHDCHYSVRILKGLALHCNSIVVNITEGALMTFSLFAKSKYEKNGNLVRDTELKYGRFVSVYISGLLVD